MFYHEPVFWVAVSFVIFAVATFKPIKNLIMKGLDSRIMKIKNELDEAVRLRQQADELLEKYKEKNRQVEQEAVDIIQSASQQAEDIIASAKSELEFTIKKRTELANQRITQAEANALKEIKDSAVDITVSAAKSLIMENLDKEAAEELLVTALGDIERKYH